MRSRKNTHYGFHHPDKKRLINAQKRFNDCHGAQRSQRHVFYARPADNERGAKSARGQAIFDASDPFAEPCWSQPPLQMSHAREAKPSFENWQPYEDSKVAAVTAKPKRNAEASFPGGWSNKPRQPHGMRPRAAPAPVRYNWQNPEDVTYDAKWPS